MGDPTRTRLYNRGLQIVARRTEYPSHDLVPIEELHLYHYRVQTTQLREFSVQYMYSGSMKTDPTPTVTYIRTTQNNLHYR